MSLTDVSVSSAARRRIRSFSVWVWIWGAIVLAIGAFNAYTGVGFGDDGFAIIGDGGNPWDAENPPIFEPDGNVYSGDGSGLISIPLEDHNQRPYVAHLDSGEYVDLYMTPAEDLGQPDNDRYYPDNVGDLYETGDEAFVIPPDGDLELWIRADDPWQITLTEADVAEIEDGFASGTDNALLVYRGDAVSARFVHKGDGIFFVTLQTEGGVSDRPLIESGEVDERISWDPSDAVYITIEADDGRGVWSVDIDELAPDAPATPNPDPASPKPTDRPADPDEPAALSAEAASAAPQPTGTRHPRGTTPR